MWTKSQLMAGALVFLLGATGCGASEGDGGTAAQIAPPQTPDQPRVTLTTETLPDGRPILCSQVNIASTDAMPPNAINYWSSIEDTQRQVRWWVAIEEPRYEDDPNRGFRDPVYSVTVSEADRIDTVAGRTERTAPITIGLDSIPGDGTQPVLLGIGQHNRPLEVLVRSSSGDWVPVTLCGGYNPLFRLADRVGLAGKELTDTYLDLLGYPPAAGLSTTAESTLMEALTFEFDEPSNIPWESVPTSGRFIDDAPPEFKATLVRYAVNVAIPEHWRNSQDALLCTRTASGWNSCIALSAVSAADYASGRALPATGMRRPDEAIQVVLLNPQAEVSGLVAQLGVVTPEQIGDLHDVGVMIESAAGAGSVLAGHDTVQFSVQVDG